MTWDSHLLTRLQQRLVPRLAALLAGASLTAGSGGTLRADKASADSPPIAQQADHVTPADENASETHPKRPQGWVPPGSLPDTTANLPWVSPQRLDLARLHRAEPSFLTATPQARPLSPPARPSDRGAVRKATHEAPLDAAALSLDPPATHQLAAHQQPRRSPSQTRRRPAAAKNKPVTDRWQHLPSIMANDEDAPKLMLAQDDAAEVFDEALLDELIPADEPARRPATPSAGRTVGPASDPVGQPGTDLSDLPDLPETPQQNRAAGAAAEAEPLLLPEEEDLPALPDGLDEPLAEDADELEQIFGASPAEDPASPESPADPMESETAAAQNADDQPAVPNAADPAPAPAGQPDSPLRIPDGSRQDMTPDLEPQPGDRFAEFNGRNCPAEINAYNEAWQRIRSKPISAISLDITPPLEPTNPAEEARKRERLKSSPTRTWYDESGEELAQGRLHDFRGDRVIIESLDGEIRQLPFYGLSNADMCFVSAWWEIPTESRWTTEEYKMRDWALTTFTWTAASTCHKPLYFEDVQLERYGHSAGPVRQVFLSGAHFFGNIIFLPYHMGLNPPNECQYTLGYYRPGSCAPWLLPAVPLNARAARTQLTALVLGLALFP